MSCRSSEFRLQVRQGRPVPFDAELSCRGGEVLALVGPSGSGKSTLLRMIAGLSRPASGSIRCGERPWFDAQTGVNLSPQQRRVGYVPQHYGLFPHLSALANVEAGLGHLPRGQRARHARTWLEKVHLDGLASRRPAELSGGQQQRVALARALAREPSILLLDEPFSAVDRATRETLYGELAELKQELVLPVVMVTHDLTEALLLADRMSLLDQGRTLQTGVPHEVMARPVSAVAARLMGLRNVFGGRLIEHDAAADRSWIGIGGLRLASRYRPEFAPGKPLDCVLPDGAIRLPGITDRALPDGPNRVELSLVRLLPMGEEVRIDARLPGVEAMLHFQVSARLTEVLRLSPGGSVPAVLREDRLHLMAPP
ncbi:ABC transporter ATP-binding protein [Fontimonas sp. SYSU GA230001]|uniref:ABC transporter ATP-binding protein n=1 Tax=Fontimonas sp. SYSU GA230001 TaxID=3142450 RepID=UPI0032B32E4B